MQPFQKTQLQPPVGASVDSPCHPQFTTTNLSYRFPIFETSATALCGTTGTITPTSTAAASVRIAARMQGNVQCVYLNGVCLRQSLLFFLPSSVPLLQWKVPTRLNPERPVERH